MVYAYVRVSTDKQSTETQRFEIKKFSKTKKIHIDRWIDETISGMKGIQNRRLGKVLRQARKGDVLITSELSRLGRNLMQVMSFLHQCMEQDITVYTIKEGYELGNNLNSKILAFAFSLSAEIERNLISQRTKEALARKKAEGIQLGRPQGGRCRRKLDGKEQIITQLLNERRTKLFISKVLGVHRQTLRMFIDDRMDYVPKKSL
ncbi:MAG: master DNA invertase Mpi family serine-type recombinase [Parabacteroides sp.]|nr:master DNA invertase Mpi family serine-type recombinase [Parabacteroides distasonis]MCI6877125.1 master DNA invertase Mpi family serine-type recombinase [Parabacteroides sp.]MDD6100500.1 master DNA invertase Mpi family serine-type recombinase [bacterium]MDD6749599.1 master DNA invertase Mpi family serine-type recombinase [bacterium]MDD6765746.1 master DNA invertase Mpi family serine-type recombinase [bacterium]